MKKCLTVDKVTDKRAKVFLPILNLLYSYSYYEEPDYNKIQFMFEKILLDSNITPSFTNYDWSDS